MMCIRTGSTACPGFPWRRKRRLLRVPLPLGPGKVRASTLSLHRIRNPNWPSIALQCDRRNTKLRTIPRTLGIPAVDGLRCLTPEIEHRATWMERLRETCGLFCADRCNSDRGGKRNVHLRLGGNQHGGAGTGCGDELAHTSSDGCACGHIDCARGIGDAAFFLRGEGAHDSADLGATQRLYFGRASFAGPCNLQLVGIERIGAIARVRARQA
jgi:hypothetical protein